MRSRIALALVCLAAFVAAGCGRSQDDPTPTACLGGAGAYTAALAAAPGKVELSDNVPISDCLAENQSGGELATAGEAMVETATKLNAEARAQPGGDASLQLGYLLGAAQRGADQSEGIHADLIRRLTVAARYSPEGPLPAAFLATYQRGFDAGHGGG
ncbi:MAG TPA: hypothetical protein VHU86_02595 [Solirubrobacterales bacterium]|jgi:hypothetical protein|nr:hypothetical protein [Solirubrobacterales bacterium]